MATKSIRANKTPSSKTKANPHRGRFQAQGQTLQKSKPWAKPSPLSKIDANQLISELEELISRHDRDIRETAFSQARKYVARGPVSVIDKMITKSYRVKDTARERVDIEVIKGTAFT